MEDLLKLLIPFLNLDNNKDSNLIKIKVLFLGKTGAGKTTLINAFANYFYGVNYKDERKIMVSQDMIINIGNESKKIKLEKNIKSTDKEESSLESNLEQSYSQTLKSTVYTLQNEFYKLRMIDTPGLLDTSGIDQ